MKTIFFILISILFIGCTKESSYSYRVTGSGSPFSITYVNSTDGTEQATGSSGWSYSWMEKPSSRFRYISAQCSRSGSVTVDIVKDGAVVKTASSSGAYSIATCSAP